jgi:hypothetical protein
LGIDNPPLGSPLSRRERKLPAHIINHHEQCLLCWAATLQAAWSRKSSTVLQGASQLCARLDCCSPMLAHPWPTRLRLALGHMFLNRGHEYCDLPSLEVQNLYACHSQCLYCPPAAPLPRHFGACKELEWLCQGLLSRLLRFRVSQGVEPATQCTRRGAPMQCNDECDSSAPATH